MKSAGNRLEAAPTPFKVQVFNDGYGGCRLLAGGELGFKGPLLAKPADAENAEPDHLSMFVDSLHERVVGGFAHEPGGMAALSPSIKPGSDHGKLLNCQQKIA